MFSKGMLAVAVSVSMGLASFCSNADQGSGVINFSGTVIDAPCGISPESADQSVDFGQLSKAHLAAGGISTQKNVDIELTNCDATALSTTGSVKVSFVGTTISGYTQELGTTGGTGTAVVMSSPSGSLVSFDGTQTAATPLIEGDNVLHYTSWVKQATGGEIQEGDFSAVANFSLTYE